MTGEAATGFVGSATAVRGATAVRTTFRRATRLRLREAALAVPTTAAGRTVDRARFAGTFLATEGRRVADFLGAAAVIANVSRGAAGAQRAPCAPAAGDAAAGGPDGSWPTAEASGAPNARALAAAWAHHREIVIEAGDEQGTGGRGVTSNDDPAATTPRGRPSATRME